MEKYQLKFQPATFLLILILILVKAILFDIYWLQIDNKNQKITCYLRYGELRLLNDSLLVFLNSWRPIRPGY